MIENLSGTFVLGLFSGVIYGFANSRWRKVTSYILLGFTLLLVIVLMLPNGVEAYSKGFNLINLIVQMIGFFIGAKVGEIIEEETL